MKRSLPPVQLRAEVTGPGQKAGTYRAVFYSGSEVVRVPLFDEPYMLSFEMTKQAADLAKFNSGGPVVDNHDTSGSVKAVVGRVNRAWIAGGIGYADFTISTADDVEPIRQRLADGTLTSVSMGATIEQLEQLEDDDPETGFPRFKATKWSVRELSLVPIPADAGALILAEGDARPCRIHLLERRSTMRKPSKCPECSVKLSAEVTDTCPECNVNIEQTLAQQVEDARVGLLHRIAAEYQLGEVWVQRHINAGTPRLEALADASTERAKRAQAGPNGISMGLDHDSAGAKIEQMADALNARARRKSPAMQGNRYHSTTIVEMAFEQLERHRMHLGLDPRHNAGRIIELALHTTSDFPSLLGNALNKGLLPEYQGAQQTYRALSVERPFRDFRPHPFNRAGDFPVPLEKNEHGEIKYGTMGESAESITAISYARTLGMSREALINDDLGAFADLPMKAARRVADFENATWFAINLLANSGMGATMADGDPVFDASHSNVGSGAIDVANVGAGWAVMQKQTSIDGIKINPVPQYLLTSPDKATVARQMVTEIAPATVATANPFVRDLTVVSDANLTSADPWYLIAAPGQMLGFVHGTIGGVGPRVDTRAGWEIEGVEVRVAIDFATGPVDWRGVFRSTGS